MCREEIQEALLQSGAGILHEERFIAASIRIVGQVEVWTRETNAASRLEATIDLSEHVGAILHRNVLDRMRTEEQTRLTIFERPLRGGSQINFVINERRDFAVPLRWEVEHVPMATHE